MLSRFPQSISTSPFSKKLNNTLLFTLFNTLIHLPSSIAMEPAKNTSNEKLIISSDVSNSIQNIHEMISDLSTRNNDSNSEYMDNAKSLCADWYQFISNCHKFINEMQYTSPLIEEGTVNLEQKCLHELFYNLELVYNPNPDSEEGLVRFKISDLPNPQEGTFDLSQCGDAGKYLTISTGYPQKESVENKNKLEIWIVRRDFIEEELKENRVQQLKGHFPEWSDKADYKYICGLTEWKKNVPIGIFWTRSDWRETHLHNATIDQSISSLKSKTLYEHWVNRTMGMAGEFSDIEPPLRAFKIS